MRRSILIVLSVFFFASTTNAQFTNVLINTNSSETAIAIDPLNKDHMIASTNIDNYFYSTDGGVSWNNGRTQSATGNAGDPNMIADSAGNFFYFHLAPNIDRIVSQQNNTFPPVWSNGTVTGIAPQPNLQDHEWAYADWTNHNLYTTWTQYSNWSNVNPTDSTTIFFSASYDHGQTWTTAQRINEKSGDNEYLDIMEPRPYSAPNGDVYVSWSDANQNEIIFDRSTDQGVTWLSQDIHVAPIPGGPYFNISGINRIRSTPFIAVDRSTGPNRGNIYISWFDLRNGLNNSDIFLVKSIDGGNTWSNAIRVNDDITVSHQFLNAMTIDQVTGNIYIGFYDRRNYTSDSTDFYLAWSNDGGNTFANVKVNQESFVPSSSSFFGDYISIAAFDHEIRPVWVEFDMFQTENIYTALINDQVLSTHAISVEKQRVPLQIVPSAIVSTAAVKFDQTTSALATVTIYDQYGRMIKEIGNDYFSKGLHSITLDVQEMSAGIYFCEYLSDGVKVSKQFAVVK